MTIQVDLSLHTGADYTAAFNAAFAQARTWPDAVQLPAGRYGVTSVDATCLRGIEIFGSGSLATQLYPLSNQLTSVLDGTGSALLRLRGFRIGDSGDQTVIPAAGILLSNCSGAASTANRISDVHVDGKWGVGPLTMYATGDNVVRDAGFHNRYDGGTNVAAVAMSNTNLWGIESAYRTLLTGAQQTSNMTFDGVEAHDLSKATGQSTISAVKINGVCVVRWISGVMSSSNVGMRITNYAHSLTVIGPTMYSENGTQPLYYFYAADNTGLASFYGLNVSINDIRGAVIGVANGGVINGLNWLGSPNSAHAGSLSGKKLMLWEGANPGTYNSLNESRIDGNNMILDLTGGGSITHTQVADPHSIIVNASNTNGATVY